MMSRSLIPHFARSLPNAESGPYLREQRPTGARAPRRNPGAGLITPRPASAALDAPGGRRVRRHGGLRRSARQRPQAEPVQGEQDQDGQRDDDHAAADQALAVAPGWRRGRVSGHGRPYLVRPGAVTVLAST